MPELASFSEFHFLRPPWLWGLVPAGLLFLILRRRFDVQRQWKGIIQPHLLRHLTVGAEGSVWLRPFHLLVLTLVLGSVAAAGPTWQQELSPFAEDAAPLVIVLDLSESMNAVDIQPSRLQRAKQKIRDLLTLRAGARTALVAYAGSAHTVLPLSDDPTIFETFLADLATEVMPVPGKDAVLALAEAEAILARDSVPGSILFLTDGITEGEVPAFAEHGERTQDGVMVLAVGTVAGGPIRTADGGFRTDASGRRLTSQLDRAGLETLSREAGVFVASTTVGDEDVDRVQRRVQTHLRQVHQEDQTARWRDEGHWLIWPMLLLTLLWFRRGWTVRWVGVGILVVLGSGCGPSPAERSAWQDLWLTSDQQGRRLADEGRWAEATERFESLSWRGVAFYRAGNLERAVDELAREDTPESNYNLGNTYASLGRYEDAIGSYDRALDLRSGWTIAEENRTLVAGFIESSEDEGAPPPGGQADPTFAADSVAFDDKAQNGERGEVDMKALTDAQIAEMWMRRLQASPADFLRRRFAIEAARGGEG